MKNKDGNGACLNCDSNQIPNSGTLLGKAIPFNQLFGSSLTSSQLSSGISITNITQDFENKARQYFTAPSDSDLTSYITNLLSTALTNVLNINWVKSAIGKNSGLNLWGSVTPCGANQAWVNLTTPNNTIGGTSYGFNYPVTNKTFNNAGYINLALSNSINQSEFVFYLQASRWNTCSQ
jgi:hypothetical protein